MSVKRGQISGFILLGIIIFATVFILIAARDPFTNDAELLGNQDLVEAKRSIDSQLQRCLEESARRSLYYLAERGGFIYHYEPIIATENDEFALSFDAGIDTSPEEAFIISELERFVPETLQFCAPLKEMYPQYNISYLNHEATVEIRDDKVLFEVNYPVVIRSGPDAIKTSRYRSAIPIRLGQILHARTKIIHNLPENADSVSFKDGIDESLEINYLPYNKTLAVISLMDPLSGTEEEPFFYTIAIRKENNAAPIIPFIPNFRLDVGDELRYTVDATDEDSDLLVFYAKEGKIPIDESSGEIVLFGTSAQVVEDTICVSDTSLAESCTDVTVVIEDV